MPLHLTSLPAGYFENLPPQYWRGIKTSTVRRGQWTGNFAPLLRQHLQGNAFGRSNELIAGRKNARVDSRQAVTIWPPVRDRSIFAFWADWKNKCYTVPAGSFSARLEMVPRYLHQKQKRKLYLCLFCPYSPSPLTSQMVQVCCGQAIVTGVFVVGGFFFLI